MYLRNQTPMATNEEKTPYEPFYGIKPGVGHVRTFGCTKVVLPNQTLGKLDDRAAMGYLLGYDGGYQVWIPRM